MKVVFFALLFVTLLASDSLVQERLAELPVSEQHEPEEDIFDYCYNSIVEFLRPLGTCERSRTLYKQCDSAWANKMISTKTICQVGCLMSSVSMILKSRGKSVAGATANPDTLNSWLKTHGGYSGNLFVWGSVAPLGLKYSGKTRSQKTVQECLCNSGCEAILNVNNGGHWVLATGYDGSGYTVNDPGYSRTKYDYSGVGDVAIFYA
mmetsp:Transcript_20040/g.23235  ORF Transcript_20040/g.23235 Transcript_20040/m.23235 type:complete len:207 (-) Transcript_20040:37-657(-)